MATVSCKRRSCQQSSRHARLKQVLIPPPVRRAHKLARIAAGDYFRHGISDGLESLPVTACCEGIPAPSVGEMEYGAALSDIARPPWTGSWVAPSTDHS